MDFFSQISHRVLNFFAVTDIIEMIHSGNYSSLTTYKGFIAVIEPLFPIITVLEFLAALLNRKLHLAHYKISLFSHVINSIAAKFISITVIAFCIGLFEKHAIFKTSFTWYWFLYSYVIWELGHFIFHYLVHKVRLLWCLHSTHHAPQNMNLSINFAHFFFEMPFANIIRTTTCILLGVDPVMFLIIMFIDGTWGAFVHMGESISKTGKLGLLSKFILTPVHHRIHHARNPLYIDTNFCNLINIWDRIFHTYQTFDPKIQLEYGITRKLIPNSFLDAYFGEFVALAKDVVKAPGIVNKLLYIFMPPGWSHIGEHKTASKLRREFFNHSDVDCGLVTDATVNSLSDLNPDSLPDESARRY